MKCLSVRQPWAWLIVHGYKDIENRSWKTKYRGRLLIHAPLTFNLEAWRYVRVKFPDIPLPVRGSFAMAAIIGSVLLTDIVQESSSSWFEGRDGWVLKEALAYVRAVPYRGQLGLLNVPSGLLIGREPPF